jgi:predicted ATPase/DNA-binding winged helix-turn-helix (wHTH) protein
MPSTGAFVFGDFKLVPTERALYERGAQVRVGGRALEILIALVEQAGEVVTKEAIFERVWPNTHVVEVNLRVHLAALRKALGDGLGGRRYLTTAPGQGYSFVAPVVRVHADATHEPTTEVTSTAHTLPAVLTHVVGQERPISEIATNLEGRRLMTVIGPGGIGKTTVALTAAKRLVTVYPHGVYFVDLAALANPRLVASALASAIGLPTISEDPVPNILAFLRGKKVLIVLDNCEHLIEPAARLVDRLLSGAPTVNILATSREPFRANGEWLLRLPSLELPPASATGSASSALAYSAIQLFVERVIASVGNFELEDDAVGTVVDLCRRLDGIPLAIELAAAGVHHLGLAGLAKHLDMWLSREGGARRTRRTRQRTLRATLDWSYERLSKGEQVLLRRLSVFRDSFSVAAATAIASPAERSPALLEDLSGLAFKSMITADTGDDDVSYRLLEIVRGYAHELLERDGERNAMMRRLALHCVELLAPSEVEWETRPTDAWLATYAHATSDVRAALSWAFSDQGDHMLGCRLVVVSSTLFFQLSLLDEYRGWLERVLDAAHEHAPLEPADEMSLKAALGLIVFHSRGPTPEVARSFQRVLEIADSLGASAYQLRALWGLFADAVVRGEYANTRVFAERFGCVLEASPELKENATPSILHERMMSFSFHLLGEQEHSRSFTSRVLDRPMSELRPARAQERVGSAAPTTRSRLVQGFPDHHLATRSTLARVCWLQGFPDEALDIVRQSADEALELGDEVSLCYSLSLGGVPVALWTGAESDAERFVAILLERSTRHSFRYWRSWGLCYQAVLARRRGQALSFEGPGSPFDVPLRTTQLEVAVALGEACIESDDLARIDSAVRQDCSLSGWCAPEIVRLGGEVARRTSNSRALVPDAHFLEALDRARKSGDIAWELRAATSIARAWRGGARQAEGRDLLEQVYRRFTEGHQTSDLVVAHDFLTASA